MNENARDNSKATSAAVRVSLVLLLCCTNTALLYFVIWDMFSKSNPYGILMFAISGSAHLLYLFLPWFVAEQLGPFWRSAGSRVTRFDNQAIGGDEKGVSNFTYISVQFGVGLCLATITLWSLQSELGGKIDHNLALITRANCLEIGGKPEAVGDKLICIIENKNPDPARSGTRDSNR